MKKNLVALAVAAAAFAPFAAQADITVSAGIQSEIASFSGDGVADGVYITDGAEGQNPRSGGLGFVKFMGTYDLGDGLTAIGMANFSASVADGIAPGARDGFVALKGGFGTVIAGRVSSSYKSATVKWDPFLTTTLQARGSNGMSALHNSYVNDVLAYDNKFGQVHVQLAIAFDEVADPGATPANSSTYGNNAMTGFIKLPLGPVEVALAFIDASEMGNFGGTGATDVSATKLGVKYSGGGLTAALQVENLGKGLTGIYTAGAATPSTEAGTVTYGTVSYAVGANTFALGAGATDFGGTNNASNYMAVGVRHAFNKKVTGTLGVRNSTYDNSAMDTSVVSAGLAVKI